MNDRQREFTKSQRFKNNNHNRAPNPSCLLRDGPRYLASYHYSKFFLPPTATGQCRGYYGQGGDSWMSTLESL